MSHRTTNTHGRWKHMFYERETIPKWRKHCEEAKHCVALTLTFWQTAALKIVKPSMIFSRQGDSA